MYSFTWLPMVCLSSPAECLQGWTRIRVVVVLKT